MLERKKFFAACVALFPFSLFLFCQQENVSAEKSGKAGFQAGIYAGTGIANKYTAEIYDGYGYDLNGKKNAFTNSFMYRRIVIDYGGGNGLGDQIAQALNVNPGEWSFDESDMPVNLKYNPMFSAGLTLCYKTDKTNSFLLDVLALRLSVNGNFSIVIINPNIGPQQPGYQNIQVFPITGVEQRTNIRFAYRKFFGEDKTRFFLHAGAVFTSAKFLKNQISVNTLHIDVAAYYGYPEYAGFKEKFLRGNSFGVFSGAGINYRMNEKTDFQISYDASVEKINMGENPKHKIHHALGLCILYNL